MPLNEQSRKIEMSQVTSETAVKDELATRIANTNVNHRSYHELGDQHIVERDVLEQLRFNLKQLEDLHSRFAFMMSEVTNLIRNK